MEDKDIYEMANNVLSVIAKEVEEATYSPVSGSLNLAWSHLGTTMGCAHSYQPIENPPDHKIVIGADFVCHIYRDIEFYFKHAEAIENDEIVSRFFGDMLFIRDSSNVFSEENQIINAFIGAITWIFFHELGHLLQEHGYIRNVYSSARITEFQEILQSGDDVLQGEMASIYHVTELMADRFATINCNAELLRHFKGDELEEALYIFTCGVSCVLYRFNQNYTYTLNAIPVGSHPRPLIRLENLIPIIYEFFDAVWGKGEIGKSKAELAYLCNRAAYSVGISWNRDNLLYPNLVNEFMIKGILARPESREYMANIIATMGTIRDEMLKYCRFDSGRIFLDFTEEYKTALLAGE